jgi:DNA-binding phage protein
MSDGDMIAGLMAAIGALFSALLLAYRQAIADWKGLYERERADRIEVEKLALAGINQANEALRQILAVMQALPRRKTDWEGKP